MHDKTGVHIIAIHENVKELQCSDCEFSTHQLVDLRKHIKSVHNKNVIHEDETPFPFPCTYCEFSTQDDAQLKEHMKRVHRKVLEDKISKVKAALKMKLLKEETKKDWEKCKSLVIQGKSMELLHQQEFDATWKSYIFNLPRGTMKYILNASIDTLPSKTNLRRWGKVSNDLCLCKKKQTLNHILNGCSLSLKSGKFTWRHDNVLRYIKNCIDNTQYTVSIDLGQQKGTKVSTIPPDILVINLIPDVVIVDKNKKSCDIFELTCPGEARIEIAHKIKVEKYAHFTTDIKEYKTKVIAFEIGSNTGTITPDNKARLEYLFKFCRKGLRRKAFIQNISAIVMLGSYHLFNCREDTEWNENTNPISGPFKDE